MARGLYTVLAEFPSRSRPGVTYEVRQGGDGVVYCSCPKWRFQQGRGGCPHLTDWKTQHLPKTAAGDWHHVDFGSLLPGDILEVQDRGLVFLLRYTAMDGRQVHGQELLDLGQAPSSLRAERVVDAADVVRVIKKTEAPR